MVVVCRSPQDAREFFGGLRVKQRAMVSLVWNWPVFAFTWHRWNHEDSRGLRIRFAFWKFQYIKDTNAFLTPPPRFP